MRRDPWPIALAGATAVVSCGLLALAIAYGWLGPDVGRGANFCEAPRDWAVRQPANTFSNLGFVAAGLRIAVHASRRSGDHPMPRPLASLMASVVVLLGPASAAMHATQASLGGHLDQLSMALMAAFATGYAVMRWRRAGVRTFVGVFAAAVAFSVLVGRWPVDVPVVRHPGNLAFALLLVTVIGLETAIIRRGDVSARAAYVYGSLAAMVSAFAIWTAANTWLCDPHSLLQGHAAWHVLGAVAAYLLYRYYASERLARPDGRDRPDAVDAATSANAGRR
jgi:hypothetical protein